MDLRDFLARLQVDRGPNASGEYLCTCPAHSDKTASLCVKDGDKGIVIKCQAGCDTKAVLAAMGLNMHDLFRGDDSLVPGAKVYPAKPGVAKKSSGRKPRGKFVCAYSYTDEQGKVLFEACRYQRDDGSKTFSLRQPDPANPGNYLYTKAGVRLVLYKLPAVLEAVHGGKPVFVVEGEKDADNMAALGYTATTNPMGAGKWQAADYAASLAGAEIYIIPDNDDVGRKHAETVAQSVLKTAKSVRILDLAAVCDQLPAKGDISDLYKLMGRKPGDAALRKLMETTDVYAGSPQAERDLAADQYKQIFGYCVDRGRICQETQEGPKPLGNFVAMPRTVVSRDDGVNIVKDMVIDGWSADGATLPRVCIKATQFAAMNWVTEHWDFAASIMPGSTAKDRLRYVIGEVGNNVAKRVTEYTHTGWRKIGGKWAYLYHGGAIGAENVTVDLGSGLNRYRLDGGGDAGFKALTYLDGARATLAVMDCMAEHIAIPLLGTIFLAPLREFLSTTGHVPAYLLFLSGGTGARKSTAAALALSHFGNFTSLSPPASFIDTANFIRKKSFLLKDTVLLIDDYHPVTNLQERKKMEATAQSIARAFGDGAERGRMRADLSLQEAMPPRSLAIVTGEDVPGIGESGMARFYQVPVIKGDVPISSKLTELQEKARLGYLQKTMRGYLKWLLKQADELPDMLHDAFFAMRTMAQEKAKGQHGRTAGAIAHIMLGYDSMLRYLRDVGALTTEECMARSAHAWEVVASNSARQSDEMRDERPSKIFLSALGELLISESVSVVDMTAQKGSAAILRDMIGYMDASFYYLMPGVAYRAVAKLCNDQGQAFPLSLKMLFRQMREDGVLTADTTTPNSATRGKWINGRTQRLLWIPRKWIDGPKVAAEQQRMQLDKPDYTVVDPEDDPTLPF